MIERREQDFIAVTADDIQLARRISYKFHAGQTYGPFPYSYHTNAVEELCGKLYPLDERTRIIGQLHDVLEDTVCTIDILNALFDDDIVRAVIDLTKGDTETRDEYLIRVKANPLALKVKIADAYCNLTESLLRGDMKRVRRYGNTLALLTT